ncbi:MAG: T9SS type A sorting domain-containing protein, partial [Muribaculaceae bacterium]
TGVESVETANATVFAANGTINVSSDAEASIEVYTANGQMVRAISADNASIAVAPGFYLVKVGNQVSKVVVK